MKTTTLEQMAEAYINHMNKKHGCGRAWNDRAEIQKEQVIEGMRAALTALYASIEGVPSVEEASIAWHAGPIDFRNLFIAAFAKQLEAMTENRNHWASASDKAKIERDAALAKLSAVAKLPDKWRDGCHGECLFATDLEAALALPVEPTYHTPSVVQQRREDAAAIQAVMNPPVEADPYAELKAARAAGKIIQWNTSTGWANHIYPGEEDPMWIHPAKDYRVKPEAPAEPWAKEEAAHARGERIQARPKGSPNGWWDCVGPMWHEDQEYRIAPTPVPAGKLTDAELGEIGAKAAQKSVAASYRVFAKTIHVDPSSPYWQTDAPARAAFAAAVSAEVRKECEEAVKQNFNMVTQEADRWEKRYNEQTATAAAIAKERDDLRAEITAKDSEIANQTKEYGALIVEHAKLQKELAAKDARLAALEWRDVNVKPTREDADELGHIECLDGRPRIFLRHWDDMIGVKMWRPFYPNAPRPAAEEKERREFEETMQRTFEGGWLHSFEKTPTGEYYVHESQVGFRVWQAARGKGTV